MGKKIPGKKHHGVKDPEKQKKKREAPMKLKANARPKNLDDQEIPKKLMIISKLREDAKKPNVPKPKPQNPKTPKPHQSKKLLF